MNTLLDRFDGVLDGLARLNAYPFPQRHAQWLQRLAVNTAEIDALLTGDDGSDIAYLQPPATPLADGGVAATASNSAASMVALAQQHRLDPASMTSCVRRAWQAAHDAAHFNAFIHLAPWEQLKQQITALTQTHPTPSSDAPLFGVPIAIKDLMRVQGHAMTGGSGGALPAPQTQDAVVVARLRQAGAIILGTTNLHELAYGITSENPHHGWVGNPHGLPPPAPAQRDIAAGNRGYRHRRLYPHSRSVLRRCGLQTQF